MVALVVPFLFYKHHGVPTAAIRHAQYVDNIVLAAATAETVTRPSGAVVAVFAADQDFYVDWDGGTAIVPSVDKTDGAGVELNPAAREMGDLSTISVISPNACVLTIAWYGGNV